ncbi:hypothetical protein FEO87_07605 [Stenotrophomonas maltophilia]|nr:hypothetical protein FEO87_07605 [Stenotrophomonas maltophilia]
MPHHESDANLHGQGLRPYADVMQDALAHIQDRHARPLVRLQERLSDGRVAVEIYDRTRPGEEPTYDFYCSGPLQAVEWIRQVAPKTWITKEHITVFSSLILEAFPQPAAVQHGEIIEADIEADTVTVQLDPGYEVRSGRVALLWAKAGASHG